MNDKIEKLRDLFRQREAIDAEIVRVLEGGAYEPLALKAGRKLKAEPAKTGKKRGRRPGNNGRPPKPSNGKAYKCQDCGQEFVSTLSKLDVTCPDCCSVHVK